MLKMYANGKRPDGSRVRIVVLGLSYGNLRALKNGRPIKFTGETCGLEPDIEFMIFAGETEQSMQREFHELIGPDTKVSIDPRLRD
jgi:hypothetical protein